MISQIVTETSKASSNEVTTQNEQQKDSSTTEKDGDEDISPTKGLFDKLIEKAPPKKLETSRETASNHDQDDVEMEDEDSPVPGLRISSIVTMSGNIIF